MSALWVATRDGIISHPESGEKFRIVKGKTLGDPRHPAVAAYPENWFPLDIELSVAEPDPEAEGEAMQLAGELHDARAEADGYREQLVKIADLAMARGLVRSTGIEPDHEGWLVEVLTEALPAAPAEDVAPPAPARKARSKAATPPPVVGDAE